MNAFFDVEGHRGTARISDCRSCPIYVSDHAGRCPFRSHGRVAGDILFVQGASMESLWLLKDGFVLLTAADGEGQERVQHLRSPGAILGWELLSRRPAETQAAALTDVELCVLPRSRVGGWLGPANPLSRLLHLAVIELARRHEERWLTTGSASGRLARFLLFRERARMGAAPLPLERQQLARLLGMRAETLCRVERRFRDAGLLAAGPELRVLDRAGIEAAAA